LISTCTVLSSVSPTFSTECGGNVSESSVVAPPLVLLFYGSHWSFPYDWLGI